ncbi:hypothetical protein [uncultured Bartonella sp.]|nr:hypothetical protein [uncultured Bartonella sp.]
MMDEANCDRSAPPLPAFFFASTLKHRSSFRWLRPFTAFLSPLDRLH